MRNSEWNALCEAKGKLHLGKILIVFFLITLDKLTTYILLLEKEKKSLNLFPLQNSGAAKSTSGMKYFLFIFFSFETVKPLLIWKQRGLQAPGTQD